MEEDDVFQEEIASPVFGPPRPDFRGLAHETVDEFLARGGKIRKVRATRADSGEFASVKVKRQKWTIGG